MQLNSPIKMTYGPPRRATGMIRYAFLAAGAIGILYYLRLTAQNAALSSTHLPIDVTPSHIPGIPSPEKPADPMHTSIPEPAPMPHNEHAPASVAESTAQVLTATTTPAPVPSRAAHAIDTLMGRAEKKQEDLLKKESKSLQSAAAAYRERRGRHPPPGFDVWYDNAKDNDVIMVEDFFDQIYHDLAPFWGLPAANMRKEAHEYDMTINIRNQKATSKSDWFWTVIWLNMTQTLDGMLPDMDLPLNAMDEPRILVAWEEVNRLMEIERASRHIAPPSEVLTGYQTLTENQDPDTEARPRNYSDTRPYWQAAIRGCHPDSPARKAQALTGNFNGTPSISLKHALDYTYKGYVENFTASTDFCNQPDMQTLHGMMINPLTVSESNVFAPLFGGSKLPTNNEILLPAPMYWSGEERFDGGGATGVPWTEKLNKVIWRGVATGGRNTKDNWKGFQRHRFVAQTNGSKVSNAESWSEIPENWAMPTTQYNLAAQQENRLGEWTKEWADTGFVDLMCDPPPPESDRLHCNHTGPYFDLVKGVQLAEQFNRKYLPDIDGNSFSGRYRGFLLSTSVPIKATIFREWHDSRLMPWLHFVPMDNRFLDFWGIMEYFLGYKSAEGEVVVEGHDSEAEKIALVGQKWANLVLRKEDMAVYTHRLLLEYARLSDDRRERMGWVGDLVEKSSNQSSSGKVVEHQEHVSSSISETEEDRYDHGQTPAS